MIAHLQYECLNGDVRLEPAAAMMLRRSTESGRTFYKGTVPEYVKKSGLFKSEPCEKMNDKVAVTFYEYSINGNEVTRKEFERISDKLRGAV